MIEIKKHSEKSYSIYINGVEITEDYVSIYAHKWEPSNGLNVHLYSYDACSKISCFSIDSLPDIVDDLDLDMYEYNPIESTISFNLRDKNPKIQFKFAFDLDSWKQPFSINDFGDEITRMHKAGEIQGEYSQDDALFVNGFRICYPLEDFSATIDSAIDKYLDSVTDVIENVKANLLANISSESVIQQFDFPEEVSTSCEQYLLYFVQFLKDLGVEANAKIEHEAGKVLFSVTPTNHKDALDKIREALDIYLQLPYTNANSSFNPQAGIEIQRLTANIYHLNGQLTLAKAEAQAKETAIQSRDITIARLANENLFLQSSRGKEEEDKEEVLLGVYLKAFKLNGIEIDLPTLFRVLRYHFDSIMQKAFSAPPLMIPPKATQSSEVIEGEVIDEGTS